LTLIGMLRQLCGAGMGFGRPNKPHRRRRRAGLLRLRRLRRFTTSWPRIRSGLPGGIGRMVGPRSQRWIAALERAGLTGQLEAPKRLLDRAEALAAQAREAKLAARKRLEEANRALLEGMPDAAAYGAALTECGPWLDEESAGMIGMMQASAQVRSNALATAFAMATGLYSQPQEVRREVVAETAAVPELPREVWSAASSGQASTVAIRAGREADWARIVRLGDRWDSIHAAAQLLRETGQFQGQLAFPGGCPTAIGIQFLNWQPVAADGLETVRRLLVPLRLRATIDRGWRPGLWLAADHAPAAEADAKRKRGLFAALGAGKSTAGKSPAPVNEFA